MNPIDPIELQRLIDGELDFEQTQRLLRIAEENPESWRLIASSFIENQVWESGFVEDDFLGKVFAARKEPVKSRSGFESMKWLALAALVILTVSVGVLFSDWGQGNSTLPKNHMASGKVEPMGDGGLEDANLVADFQPLEAKELSPNPALYQVKVEDSNGRSIVNSTLPFEQGQSGDADRWMREIESSEWANRRVPAPGYQVEQKIRYIGGQLENGRGFVVPIKQSRYSFGQ